MLDAHLVPVDALQSLVMLDVHLAPVAALQKRAVPVELPGAASVMPALLVAAEESAPIVLLLASTLRSFNITP